MDQINLLRETILRIKYELNEPISIMEVCGSHTEAVKKYGIEELVTPNVRLLSGPGCPVCVTPERYIDHAIHLLSFNKIIMTTFGDMLRVKGSKESLLNQKEKGRDIRVLYSPLEAIEIAKNNPMKEVIFLAVGFETTAPIIALSIHKAYEEKIMNLSYLLGIKRMEPILRYILEDKNHGINGLICPGHVAAVMGAKYFEFITNDYHIPAVIAGFKPEDIISAIYYFVMQRKNKTLKEADFYKNQYNQCVSYDGNIKAKELMKEVFCITDTYLRGVGQIKDAGYQLNEWYQAYDAVQRFSLGGDDPIKSEITNEFILESLCRCTDILLGKYRPQECSLFMKVCNPEHPIGPCMISNEGSCAICYKYNNQFT